MKRLRPLSFAFLASAAARLVGAGACRLPGSCSNGKAVYNKTNPANRGCDSCSNSTCHNSDPSLNTKNIQNGSGNPSAINNALDGTSANAEMVALDLRNNLPLSAQDIDDIATYLFYIVCPTSATQPPGRSGAGDIRLHDGWRDQRTNCRDDHEFRNVGTAPASAVPASNPIRRISSCPPTRAAT